MHALACLFAPLALLGLVGASLSGVDATRLERHHRLTRRFEVAQPQLVNTKRRAARATSGCLDASRNGICLGLVPDEGDANGPAQSLSALDTAIGRKFSTFGWYAQAHPGVPFTGSQITPLIANLSASGAVFEAAVMPTGGFQGFSAADPSQAINVCTVMKRFTDAGIPTRLRFAHECNWYIKDGTYSGSLADCKSSFTTVAQTCRKIAPAVQMFLSPNVDGNGMSVYTQLYPDDPSLVDVCGIDFYPKSAPSSSTFVSAHKQFHDYCRSRSGGRTIYAIAETGLGYSASRSAQLNWLKQMTSTSTVSKMPGLKSVTWFNYDKEEDFRIIIPGNAAVNAATKKALGL